MLRQVPRWLLNEDGPRAVDKRYAIRAIPWLMGRLRSGNIEKVRAASDAFRVLHKPALEIYRDLLGTANYHDLIRQNGHIEVWEGTSQSESERIGRELWVRHDIKNENLSIDVS